MRTDAVGELEPILDVASRKQPEQYANARKLAGEMHLPMDVVERNHDQVLSEQTKRINMQLLGMAPGTAEYMRRNPEVVPAVTDMVEEMGLFERTLASIPNAIGAGVAQQRISELQREDMRGRATPGSLAELRALQKQEAARPDYGLDPVQAAVEGRYGEAALASIPTTLQEIPELWEEIKYRVGFGAGGAAVGAGVGALGANPVTISGGAATGFVTSQNIGGFVAMREQTIGPLYAYYRNLDDVDEGEARALAEVASTFSGVLNSLPTSALLRRTPVLGGFFQRLTTDALREVLAQRTFRSATKHILGAYAEGFALEGLAEAGDQLNQYVWQALNNVREGREFFDGIRVEVPQPDGSVAILEGLEGIVADMMMTGFQGALAGGGMSGTFEATSATIDLARQDRTDHRLAIAARALQQAQGSALRERDPQTFRDHVQSLVDQGMLEENVEVTREALREFFQSADEAEVEAAWENIAALQEQDGVAYETGADFQIPVADFLTYLAGSAQTPELAQHVRWNEKDFTAAEMADLEGTEELAQRVVASVAQRLDEVTEGDEVLEAFREQRLEQLLKVHPPGIAQSLADYATAVMAVRQQRLNMPLIDILDREAELQIVPPGDPRDQPYDGPTLEQRLERRRLESFVSDMRAGRNRLADQAPLRPILSHLRDLGGIDPDSPLAGDLRSMGVAARGKGSFPGLYRTGGMADLGEIDMAEHAWLGAYFDVDDVGSEADQGEPGTLESRRASPEQIMAAIDSELRGEALRPPELEEMIGEVEAERGRIREAIEEAGLSLEDSPMDEILDALQTQEDPPMPEGMPAPGETFYEGGLLPPGLKSVLLEVATTLPKKAPIADYRSALEKQVEKGNVKADELEFSGLLEYMEMAEERGDELTRRDIVQFLQEGGLQVKVNLLGGESSEATNLTSRYAGRILLAIDPHTINRSYVRNLSGLGLLEEDLPPSPFRDRALIVYGDSVDELSDSDSEQVWTTALPRYDVPDLQVELQNLLQSQDLNLSIREYPDIVGRRRAELVQQYPNGRKYIDPGIARDNDELLMLMLLAKTNFADEYFAALDAEPPSTQAEKLDGPPEFRQYISEAGSGYMEILVTLPKRADETRQPFTAGHWGSNPADVVVSLLAEERDGKLFIFEMQSDWHQRGRKYGYATAASQENEAELHGRKATLLTLRSSHISGIHAEMDRHLSAVGLSVESSDELDIRRRLREEGGSIKIPLQPVRDGGVFDPDGDHLVLVQLGEEGKDGFGFGAHIETDGPDGSTTTRLPFDFAHAHRAVRAARHHLALEDSKTKELIARHDELQDRLSNLREMVPAAPFSKTQSWTDLGLKNALLQAYAMNLSGVVMTDAELVFDRWGDEGVKSYYTKTVPKRMRALAQKYGGEVEPLQEWDGVPAMGAINFTPELADAIESDSIELFQAVATDFAGIGTVDAMLPQHPSVHAAELQPDIVSAYNDAHGTNYRARDVLQVDPRELEDADLYHASPVCTNLSAARKGRGVSDLDEASARKVAANILATRPPAVTIENVPLYADTVLLEIITAALDEEGYTYDVATYDAADYGGAQTRKRMILRAVREGELPPLPEKSEPGDWFDSVRDLIDEAEDAQIPNWERTRLDAMIERGEIDPELPIITMGGSTDKRRANAKNAGGPSPTLTATPKSVPRIIMPDGTVKKVSPRMMARLMGLPDTFRIPEDNWALSKTVMGNGVHGAITTAIIGPVADLGEQIAQRGQMELFQSAVADAPSTESIPLSFRDDEIPPYGGDFMPYKLANRRLTAYGDLPQPKRPQRYFQPTEKRILRSPKTGRDYKKPRIEVTPGASEGAAAFVDYSLIENNLYIEYAITRPDMRGQGIVLDLITELANRHPEADLDFGRIITPSMRDIAELFRSEGRTVRYKTDFGVVEPRERTRTPQRVGVEQQQRTEAGDALAELVRGTGTSDLVMTLLDGDSDGPAGVAEDLNLDSVSDADFNAAAAAVYYETQKYLRRIGAPDVLTVYRAVTGVEDTMGAVNVTTSLQVARNHASGAYGSKREIVTMQVRREDVLYATDMDGGTFAESELIVRPDRLNVLRQPVGRDQEVTEFFQSGPVARISTRKPTVKDAPENVMDRDRLVVSTDSYQKPEAREKAIRILADYPNFRPRKGESADALLGRVKKQLVENLIFLHNEMPVELRERARHWYKGANRLSRRMATRYGVEHHAAAAVLAALSPQKDWFMNVSLAERVLDIFANAQNRRLTQAMIDDAVERKRVSLANTKALKGKPKEQKKRLDEFAAKLAPLRNRTLSSVLRESDMSTKEGRKAAGMWVRTFSQVAHDPTFRVVTPEGRFAGVKLNKDGTAGSVAWGGYGEIGDAIAVLVDPTRETISERMGVEHKVRNFFNNIIDPSNEVDVTIDTHAVAAALLRALGQSQPEVKHNFGGNKLGQPGPGKDGVAGISGTYAIFADAYREAAAELGIMPRELQSITWEAVRGLFPPDDRRNEAYRDSVDAIWRRHRSGTLTAPQARRQAYDLAAGIDRPDWAGSGPRGDARSGDSSLVVRLSGDTRGAGPAAGQPRRPSRRGVREGADSRDGGARGARRPALRPDQQFEQPSEGESPRGSIRLTRDLSQQTIVWSNQADLSTFLHENAHLWLEMLQADAEVEGGDPTLAEDLATLRSFLGVPEGARIEGEAHEKFARLVELYIMDGQAPTAEMAVMFQRFSRWLLDIYNSLRKRMGYFGELELSDEVRGVLDRMHATQAQIDQAREQRGLDLALFDSDTQAEMDREAWIKYQQALDSSRRGAQHAFHKRVVSRIKRQLSEDYRARRASVRDEVEAELAEDPLWKARTWLQRGEMPGERPESLPEERDGLKLDRDDLVRLFGKEILKELPFGRYGVWQRDGMPVELVVAHFGLESEDQLVRFLADSRKQSLKKEIEERTDRLMDERFGELNNSDELEDATVEALASDPALKALILEEQALARQAGGRPRPATIMRQQIQAMVGGMQYLQLQPARFQRAAAKAAREAVAAVAAGDAEAAREAKQRQIAAVMMERAQRQAIRRSEAHRKALAKIAQPSNATHRKLGRAGYWDQVATLLEGIELKASVSRREIEKRESLLTWIAAREAEDGSTEGIPDWLRERANLRSWKLLTVDELQGVRDAVDNIVALARLKVDLQVAGEKRAMDDVAEELAQAAEENVNARTRETPPGTQESGVKARLERSQQTLLGAEASLLKIENILDRLDGFMDGGPWRQAIWLPLKKAREERAQRWDEFSRRYAELVENVSKGREKEMLEKRHYRELERSGPSGTDGIYNKWSLIMMLLNLGNDSNKKKLLEGYGWSEPVLLSILSEQLTDRDLDFVEAVWELVNELWPEIRDQQIRLEGVAPPKVEGREVQIGNRKLRGQYFPVVYDLSRSKRQQELGELGAIFTKAQNSFMRPLTGHGHTKARVKVAYPIKLETNVIASHMDQVILDLTHRETLLQIDRLLRHSKVRDAVEATLGEDQYKLFRPWLQRIAADAPTEATSVKGIDRVLRAIRVHGTTMALGFRATTLAMQASGNFNGISFLKDRVGPGWMRHYMEALKTSGLGLVGKRRAELRDAVFADSAFMRGRIDSIDRDMRTIQREAESALPGERYFQAEGKLRAKAMALIGVVQLYSVDIPIWNAAYNAGMLDLGMTHEAAVDFADQAVSQTQGSGGVMDQSQLQSAAEAYKMLTTFFSYHNTLYQKLREAGVRAVERKEYMRLLSEAVLLLVLPFVWAQLARAAIRELTDGDGEEYVPQELADVPMWLLAGTIVEGVSTIPGIREGAPLISKWLADGHYFESRVPFQRLIGDVQDLGDVKSDTDLAADLVRLIAGWGRGLPIDQSVDLLEKALED